MLKMQCILAQNQTTPEKTLSNPWFGKGFCEPHQYKSALERCEGGYRSYELGINIYEDLVKILESSAAAIRQWSTASQKHICQSKEFGTTKKAWVASVRAIEKIAERNDHIAKSIQNDVIGKITTYKSENYGKSFIHVKKLKEFEKEFKKTQKSWLELLEKINDAKQTYQEYKGKLQQAEKAGKVLESDAGSTDEEKEKARTSIENRKKKVDARKSEYEKLIAEMGRVKPSYEENMYKILERTDEFERKRLEHFKTILTALQNATSIEEDKCHPGMFTAFKDAIGIHNVDADIKYFNDNYGRGTTTKWPVFEDL